MRILRQKQKIKSLLKSKKNAETNFTPGRWRFRTIQVVSGISPRLFSDGMIFRNRDF